MKISNYKHLNNTNFALTEDSVIYCNDIFMTQDIMELIEMIAKGKNPNPENISLQDCDSISINKTKKTIKIPSLFNLQKDVLNGSKALLSLLLKEVILVNKFQNETLNILQNLLNNFNFEGEFPQIKDFKEQIYSLTDLKIELSITENIEKYFMDNFDVRILNNDFLAINIDEISLNKSRIIYFKILEWLTNFYDENTIVIFENPYFGLNYDDIILLKSIISKISNKIIIFNSINKFYIDSIDNLSIILDQISINLPVILDDWSTYEFYLSKKYDSRLFLESIIYKMINNLDLFHDNWNEHDDLTNDENLFWENLKNRIF